MHSESDRPRCEHTLVLGARWNLAPTQRSAIRAYPIRPDRDDVEVLHTFTVFRRVERVGLEDN